jgi:hypothetical protein
LTFRAQTVSRSLPLPVLLVMCLALRVQGGEDESAEVSRRLAVRAAEVFQTARERYLADTNQAEPAWQFARAAFDLAEYATNNAQRASLAERGIAATRALIAREPQLVAAHYYLGMNLGQLARTRTLGALRLVAEMEEVFERARKLDPHFDHAGPDRNLGLLYRDAPGWPTSLGSSVRARQHLLRAAKFDPEYPENRLNLAESFAQWGEPAAARKELDAVNELWPKAREQLTGDAWEAGWLDWEKRRGQLQRKLAGTLPKDEKLKRGRLP